MLFPIDNMNILFKAELQVTCLFVLVFLITFIVLLSKQRLATTCQTCLYSHTFFPHCLHIPLSSFIIIITTLSCQSGLLIFCVTLFSLHSVNVYITCIAR